MIRLSICALLSLCLLLPARATPVSEAAAGSNQFGHQLYLRLSGRKENPFFSPYSVSMALAMTAAGARGQTRQEMESVLGLPKQNGHEAWGALFDELSRPSKEYELAIANRLWPHVRYPIMAPFRQLVEQRYHSSLEGVDYSHPQVARKTINDWVARVTHERIKNLIPDGVLSDDTRLVLTNAVYFKGQWETGFDPKATRQEPFTRTDGHASPCPMMHLQEHFRYGERDGAQVLELPYRGGQLAMLVVLPNDRRALPALEKKLPGSWRAWTDALAPRTVDVSFPRYRVNAEYRLESILPALGMRLLFDSSRCDLSGILDAKPLYVSAVLHKAFVEVNEKGTEAAAATAVVTTKGGGMPARPVTFRADHPFLYAIRDVRTGTVLFLGRLDRP